MRLLIKQRVFAWGDTYDVYDERNKARYSVESELFSFGHQIHVYEKNTGREVGSVHQKLLHLLPTFEIVIDGKPMGSVYREFSFLQPRYRVEYRNWDVEGDFLDWDYRVYQGQRQVMTISQVLFAWGDTYVLEYENPSDEIPGLLLVLAIDAANCSRD